MRAYLVTEGTTDAVILGPILRALGLADVSITEAGGKALTTSLARSLALARQVPVAVVVDADTRDASLIRQQRQIFADLTTGLGRANECKLFQAVPNLEDDLFHTSKDFEEVWNTNLAPHEKKEFRDDKLGFVRGWVRTQSLNKASLTRVNAKKARKVIDTSGLQGLLEFLEGVQNAVPA